MRLIDADALMKNRYLTDKSGTTYGERAYVTFYEIENAPTIEPERKKGKWKWMGCGRVDYTQFHPNKSGFYSTFCCTSCLKENYRTDKYCPNCDAKMEE